MLRKQFLRFFGANWREKLNKRSTKYAGGMTTNKYTDRYERLSVYSKRGIQTGAFIESYIHQPNYKMTTSLFHLACSNYIVCGAPQAFLHTGATHLGMHLSTLYLFCKNFIRLHDVDVYPVLCLVNTSSWLQEQSNCAAVDLRRGRTKFLGNLVIRGRKETILRAYGSAMMHV